MRYVPLAIVVWRGMYVVRSRIAIHNTELLSRSHREHMRFVLASFLFHYCRLVRHWKCRRSQAVRDVNHDVLESATCICDHILRGCSVGMSLRTEGIGRHVDSCRFLCSSLELDYAGHRRPARGRSCTNSIRVKKGHAADENQTEYGEIVRMFI